MSEDKELTQHNKILQQNYREVRKKIDETCMRIGREPSEVTLIAVSKTKPLSDDKLCLT